MDYLPRFSAELLISFVLGQFRPRWLPPEGFKFPGECSDWLLCRRMVGSRATNDALCLKLDDARLISDLELNPLLLFMHNKYSNFCFLTFMRFDVNDIMRVRWVIIYFWVSIFFCPFVFVMIRKSCEIKRKIIKHKKGKGRIF